MLTLAAWLLDYMHLVQKLAASPPRWGSRVGQAVGRFFGNSAILIKFYLPMVSISFLLLLVRHLLLLVRHLLLLASCLNSIYLLFLLASCYY